jgi:hypothetical protein
VTGKVSDIKFDRKAYNRTYMRNWRKTHPLTPEQREKDNARSHAGVYLRRGKLERQPCAECGSPAQMHHDDYANPLDVIWLCRKHHLELHKMERVFHVLDVLDQVFK